MNWFKYRLPNATEIISGASHRLIKGFGKGFVMSPFHTSQNATYTIPFDVIPFPEEIKPLCSDLPDTTPKTEYYREIDAIKASLNNKTGKTVAARVIKKEIPIDLNATFKTLCSVFPEAFIFMFSSSATGTWIGATPELLLKKEGDKLFTMALAGTRIVGSEAEWDVKNIEEQRMVTEFIIDTLSHTCSNVECGPTYTKRAGMIEHICTPISASLISEDEGRLRELLFSLSPTPAVCGSNRNLSMHIIDCHEGFDRQFYGGFCGPNQIEGKTTFFVILRAAKCSDSAVCAFAGGGITRLSDPEKEWIETEMKSQTIIKNLKSIQE